MSRLDSVDIESLSSKKAGKYMCSHVRSESQYMEGLLSGEVQVLQDEGIKE